MFRIRCLILLLLLIKSAEMQAANGGHQPFGLGEWPAILDLKQLHTAEDAASWGSTKYTEVKTIDGYEGPKPEAYLERLFPIQNRKYKQIALRSMLQGDDLCIYLSFIKNEEEDFYFSDSYYFSQYSGIGELQAYEGDLNGDTFEDYIFIKYSGGNGIAWGYADVALVLSEGDTDYVVQVLETYVPEPKDFISIKGQTAFIHASFRNGGICTDGEYHNFWTYRLYIIKENQIVAADHLSPNFPKIIWYSFKPNYQETTLLTQKRKDELIAESAMVFAEQKPELAFEWRSGIRHIQNILKTRDPGKMKDLFLLPFKITPTFIIQTPEEMRDAVEYVLDDAMIDALTEPGFTKWSLFGWRGIAFGRGDLWFGDTRNGLISATNYITEKGYAAISQKREQIQQELHPSVSLFHKTKMDIVSETYRLRMDWLDKERLRLALWKSDQSISDKPLVVIESTEWRYEGSGGYFYATFRNKSLSYEYTPYGKRQPMLSIYDDKELIFQEEFTDYAHTLKAAD